MECSENSSVNCENLEESETKSEKCLTNSDSEISTHFDNKLSIIEEKLIDLPDVWEYIQALRKFIIKQRKKIARLKQKLKERNCKEISTQTEDETVSKSITEEIKEAAENAMQNQGFVFEKTSGLYYDYKSGYYYNAEYGLYYDGNTGTYMSYDAEKREYIFHSQVEVKQDTTNLSPNDEKKSQGKSQVISSSTMDCLSQSLNLLQINNLRKQALESSNQWPPCIRIIVEETSIPSVKPGSLFVITCQGGTLGREGKHDVLLPDINVSKHHLKFAFDNDKNNYIVIDLGSRNGTNFNGKRMASSKQESEPFEIVHGSRIQVGSTILLCHIHTGLQTCGFCEPGLIQHETTKKSVQLTKTEKTAEHKKQLKNLKKKFAVDYVVDDGNLATGYVDRAQVRRDTVGSQNEFEKTQSTSLEQSITSENKGFKLLAKMGWSEGQSLGKEGTGIVEPIPLVSNHGTSGMGSKEIKSKTFKTKRINVWSKTKERYDKLQVNETFDEYDT